MTEDTEKEVEGGEKKKPRFSERFKAWWEGYDLPENPDDKTVPQEEAQAPSPKPEKPAEPVEPAAPRSEPIKRNGKPLWSATRIQVAQRLWGMGFIGPGAADYVPQMIRPLAPNKTMSFLDYGAGLGGMGQTIAKTYGAWVTGLEASPLLAETAMKVATKLEVQDRAIVDFFDPDRPTLDRRYDAIVSKEYFYTRPNKEHTFKVLCNSLKAGGQILFTDYVVMQQGDLMLLSQWCANEPIQPYLSTMDDMVGILEGNNLDVRINEDITATQIQQIGHALVEFQKHLTNVQMDPETKAAVTEEIELWARRKQALDGGLKLVRFHALKGQ